MSKKVSHFSFGDLKTNLHVQVHGFHTNGSNFFFFILIEILSMPYFVIGQS